MSLFHYRRWAGAGKEAFLARVREPVLLFKSPVVSTVADSLTAWQPTVPNGISLMEISTFNDRDRRQVYVAPVRKGLDKTTSTISIGRGKDCDVALPVPIVSKIHAIITPGRDRKFAIADAGSTHGTLVSGQKVASQPVALPDGAVLMLGSLVMLFLLPETLYTALAGSSESTETAEAEE